MMQTALRLFLCTVAGAILIPAAAAQCALNPTDHTVTICTPTAGSTQQSPVHVVAGSTSSTRITAMWVYVDNAGVYNTTAAQVDTYIQMTNGTHTVLVKSWDSTGRISQSSVTFSVGAASTAPCTLSTVSPSVTICTPANGATVTSPFRVYAGTTSSKRVTGMWAYIDGKGVASSQTNFIDAQLTATAGTHQLRVRAWDSSGAYFDSINNFTVGSGTPPPPPACTASTTSPSVTICTPTAGATVGSPFPVKALTTSSKTVTGMWAYLDGTGVASSKSGTLNAQLSAAAGAHKLMVRAWDSSGVHFDQTINFTVSSGTPPPSGITFSGSNLTFGNQIVGTTSASQKITMTNGTSSAVPISSIQISGADFSQLQNCGVQLNPGRTCEINVRFDPTIGGTRTATLQISYSDASSPKSVALTGTALAQAKPAIPINHIVWIMQENRSFDGYFGKLNDYRASLGLPQDVDGIPAAGFTNKAPDGAMVSSFHYQTMCIENTTPSWNESHYDVNTNNASADIGMMDGFVNQAAGHASYQGFFDQRGVRAMGYFTQSDLPYYYSLATQFATSDRFFSPLPSVTPANRLYALGGSSYGHALAPNVTFKQKNIFQALQDAGISWKVYYADTDSTGRGISRIWSWWDWVQNYQDHVVPMAQYFTDLQNGTLPQVALLEGGYESGRDEHPGGTINGQPSTGTHVQIGSKYVSTLINALMQSSSWKDSAFFFAFDEGGGMFDHVVPPFNAVHPDGIQPVDLTSSSVPGDFTRYGFRLPFFVVSPYAKKNYVSHTPADLTSILRFIEERFNLAPLTKRDAAQPDMREFFDFANPPWMTPPATPTQPTTGICNYTNIPE